MCDDKIPVRTTNDYNLRVGPGEIKTLHGIVRNTKDMHTAVTQHTDSSLSGDPTIYPRVVSLKHLVRLFVFLLGFVIYLQE